MRVLFKLPAHITPKEANTLLKLLPQEMRLDPLRPNTIFPATGEVARGVTLVYLNSPHGTEHDRTLVHILTMLGVDNCVCYVGEGARYPGYFSQTDRMRYTTDTINTMLNDNVTPVTKGVGHASTL